MTLIGSVRTGTQSAPTGTEMRPSKSAMEVYVENLGKLNGNLHSLEFMLRMYLFGREPDPKFDLDALVVGEIVPKNAITNYDSLGPLIAKYNDSVPANGRLPKADLVSLRDALAHGRVYARQASPPFKLVKFSDPRKGPIRVELIEKLDDAWLEAKKKIVHAAIVTVGGYVTGTSRMFAK